MVQLLHSVVDDFKDQAPGVACAGLDPLTIEVDREKMRMMLRNLIDNAVKNTPQGGKPVVVSMTRGKNHLHIVVEDRGVGIAESALPHVFDPFFRTDSSRSRKTGGFGLGLSLCKAIVDAHKGKIDISSRIGQGAKVIVMLPFS
jgi:signal transduction histidine kinase